jgi:hypothetical protein
LKFPAEDSPHTWTRTIFAAAFIAIEMMISDRMLAMDATALLLVRSANGGDFSGFRVDQCNQVRHLRNSIHKASRHSETLPHFEMHIEVHRRGGDLGAHSGLKPGIASGRKLQKRLFMHPKLR